MPQRIIAEGIDPAFYPGIDGLIVLRRSSRDDREMMMMTMLIVKDKEMMMTIPINIAVAWLCLIDSSGKHPHLEG